MVYLTPHIFCPAWATGRFDLKALWAEKGDKKGHQRDAKTETKREPKRETNRETKRDTNIHIYSVGFVSKHICRAGVGAWAL